MNASARFDAQLGQLAAIREFLTDFGAQCGVDADAVADMVQAVDEAATNIIVHGYRGRAGSIAVALAVAGGRLVVELRDGAPAFDPRRVPAPDLTIPLEQRAPGGLGVFLIRQMVDEIRYESLPGGGNVLTLVKRVDHS